MHNYRIFCQELQEVCYLILYSNFVFYFLSVDHFLVCLCCLIWYSIGSTVSFLFYLCLTIYSSLIGFNDYIFTHMNIVIYSDLSFSCIVIKYRCRVYRTVISSNGMIGLIYLVIFII